MRGYSENEDGDVVLTVSREDYDRLLMALTCGATAILTVPECFAFIDRVNAGNPNHRPYEFPADEVPHA